MSGVRRVYAGLNQGVASIDEIRAQLRVGRRYRYTYDPKSPYIPAMPAVTEAAQAGDCKGKSLWLAQKVGDRQCHFVMGKLRRNDRIAHAWLLWKNEGQWLILDPTWESEIVFAEQEVGRKWFARYSYNRSGAFVHPSYGQYVGL